MSVLLGTSRDCLPSLVAAKIYNKVARTLVAFEYLWYQAWVQSIEQAKAGLQVSKAQLSGRIYAGKPIYTGGMILVCQPGVAFLVSLFAHRGGFPPQLAID